MDQELYAAGISWKSWLSARVRLSFLGRIVFVLSQVESHDLRLDSGATLLRVDADQGIGF